MKINSFWCCFILTVTIALASSAPPLKTEGNPHPFYENPFPQYEKGERGEKFGTQILKRNAAQPHDCAACCQNLWCPEFIYTRCLCSS